MSLSQRLSAGCKALDIPLSDAQSQQLLDYLSLLDKWNKVYNLTAIRRPQDMLVRHLLDSLSVLPWVQGKRVLDIGTGGGLPGMVLAIMRPDWQLCLLDSNSKKTRFLIQAQASLALQNVEVVCSRVEQWSTEQCFDTVVSRAYSELGLFYAQARPFCCDGGQLLAMKGKDPEDELQQGMPSEQTYRVHGLNVPYLEAERHVVQMKIG